jgi:hypothetical protein
MDPALATAARALAAGDPLGALNFVALRDDAPGLALRGIAMAQLGDLPRAKALLRIAARTFGPRDPVARARCIVAQAEIALASRDLAWPTKALNAARSILVKHGDHLNAAHARLLEVRRLVLIGRLAEAERILTLLDPAPFPHAARAVFDLMLAGIAIRRLDTKSARAALARAKRAAARAGIPALVAEVENAAHALAAPAARLIVRGKERSLRLGEVESLLASPALIIDACRNVVRAGSTLITLARRPVLFAIARALAGAWPGDLSRETLVARAFGGRRADESHRARLRVEIGRLRNALRQVAAVKATKNGFQLTPRKGREVIILARPVEEEQGAILAFLADGESWSTSALALALDASQRTVQRALETLAAAGKVQSLGRGRTRRWITPPIAGFPVAGFPAAGFTTILLLPPPLPAR